jgi:outer membrane lipoprotein-sorting protein
MNVTRRTFSAFAALLCLGVHVGVASADQTSDLLSSINQVIERPDVLRGNFEQTKTLAGFKKPLVSKGTFVINRARGVQWITTSPFASTLVVTRERLTTWGEGGSKQQLDTKREPGLRVVNDLIMGMLSGDLKVLAARFDTKGSMKSAQAWNLSLTPKDAGLAGFIKAIDIDGGRHVDHVRMVEPSGDVSVIRFTNNAAGSLNPAELDRFGQ